VIIVATVLLRGLDNKTLLNQEMEQFKKATAIIEQDINSKK
jgi:hypothetical protein